MELDQHKKGLYLPTTIKKANQKLTLVDKKKSFISADQNQNNGQTMTKPTTLLKSIQQFLVWNFMDIRDMKDIKW